MSSRAIPTHRLDVVDLATVLRSLAVDVEAMKLGRQFTPDEKLGIRPLGQRPPWAA